MSAGAMITAYAIIFIGCIVIALSLMMILNYVGHNQLVAAVANTVPANSNGVIQNFTQSDNGAISGWTGNLNIAVFAFLFVAIVGGMVVAFGVRETMKGGNAESG